MNPIETIFPGLSAVRPDVAGADAEIFLHHGAKRTGFDLADGAVRRRLLGARPFVSFVLNPLPAELRARLEALPADWEARTDRHAEAIALAQAIERHYALPAGFCVILDGRNAIVCSR